MNWTDMLGGVLQQYTGGAAAQANSQPGQVEQHYDQVAQAAPTSTIASGLAAAIRSNQTPGFGQLAGQLFGGSSGSTQASLLNTLLASAGPGLLSSLGGSLPGLSSILGGGGPRQLSPTEAAQVPQQEIQHLANHAEKQDPSIVDRVSEIYAQHPTAVKTLGSAALALAMAHIAQHMQSAR